MQHVQMLVKLFFRKKDVGTKQCNHNGMNVANDSTVPLHFLSLITSQLLVVTRKEVVLGNVWQIAIHEAVDESRDCCDQNKVEWREFWC